MLRHALAFFILAAAYTAAAPPQSSISGDLDSQELLNPSQITTYFDLSLMKNFPSTSIEQQRELILNDYRKGSTPRPQSSAFSLAGIGGHQTLSSVMQGTPRELNDSKRLTMFAGPKYVKSEHLPSPQSVQVPAQAAPVPAGNTGIEITVDHSSEYAADYLKAYHRGISPFLKTVLSAYVSPADAKSVLSPRPSLKLKSTNMYLRKEEAKLHLLAERIAYRMLIYLQPQYLLKKRSHPHCWTLKEPTADIISSHYICLIKDLPLVSTFREIAFAVAPKVEELIRPHIDHNYRISIEGLGYPDQVQRTGGRKFKFHKFAYYTADYFTANVGPGCYGKDGNGDIMDQVAGLACVTIPIANLIRIGKGELPY